MAFSENIENITNGLIGLKTESKDQNENEIPKQSASPKFVVNPIIYVGGKEADDSSDEEYSSSEENHFKLLGTSECFRYRTYRVNKKNEKQDSKPVGFLNGREVENLSDTAKREAQDLLGKLYQNGLEKDSSEKIEDVVSVSMLLNRRWSLSTRKNNLLQKKSVSTEEKPTSSSKPIDAEKQTSSSEVEKFGITAEMFGMFWNIRWYDNRILSKNVEVKYDIVREYYKKLKRYDKNKAEEFRSNSEDDVLVPHAEEKILVPYQQLREKAKNHPNTKKLVDEKHSLGHCDVYLSIVDSDTVNFNGIYSAYLRKYEELVNSNEDAPTVMSTGYEFPEDKKYGVAYKTLSKHDRQLRIMTSEHIPLGIYYPEPNTCILILPNHDTVTESFIDKSREKGNLELPCLIKNILIKRGNNIRAVFFDDNALITSIPERAKLNKFKKKHEKYSPIQFSESFIRGSSPARQDLKQMKRISQFSFHLTIWYHNLFINGAIQIKEKTQQDCVSELSKIHKREKDWEDAITKLKDYVGVKVVDDFIKASKAVKKYTFEMTCIENEDENTV